MAPGPIRGRGSIPAWAGKPRGRSGSRPRGRVYPRVGGETGPLFERATWIAGLSPRGRGNHSPIDIGNQDSGSIPAWAGKPVSPSRKLRNHAVYPRVGGETRAIRALISDSPGLSPRGRGNQVQLRHLPSLAGSIPAWAGKPGSSPARWREKKVYPRVGGETSGMVAPTSRPKGLSPRGRGNRAQRRLRDPLRRSIPAWAGKPRAGRRRTSTDGVYPRVGGETRHGRTERQGREGLSPRGRGNPHLFLGILRAERSIPAWAGKPPPSSGCGSSTTVYPRVGGETLLLEEAQKTKTGLSPRGRGNLRLRQHGRQLQRSIPAWAGKPRSRRPSSGWRRVYPRVGGETSPTSRMRTA